MGAAVGKNKVCLTAENLSLTHNLTGIHIHKPFGPAHKKLHPQYMRNASVDQNECMYIHSIREKERDCEIEYDSSQVYILIWVTVTR